MGMGSIRELAIESPRPLGPSFSARRGAGPGAATLDFAVVRDRVFAVLDQFRSVHFFAEAEGKHCPDGDEPGLFGNDPNAYFAFLIDRGDVWPYRTHADQYGDMDVLCDVLEVLHSVVSKPLQARLHDFAGCGDHYVTFDRAEGQDALRACLNPVLGRLDPPLRLEANGQIVEIGDTGLEGLVSQPLPHETSEGVSVRVASAVRTFRDRHSDVDALRNAVVDLAAALEELRPRVKAEMLKKDEAALFILANGFDLRHAGRDQKGDYDKPVWLRWAFYVYLATIHAVLRVENRQAEAS